MTGGTIQYFTEKLVLSPTACRTEVTECIIDYLQLVDHAFNIWWKHEKKLDEEGRKQCFCFILHPPPSSIMSRDRTERWDLRIGRVELLAHPVIVLLRFSMCGYNNV